MNNEPIKCFIECLHKTAGNNFRKRDIKTNFKISTQNLLEALGKSFVIYRSLFFACNKKTAQSLFCIAAVLFIFSQKLSVSKIKGNFFMLDNRADNQK